MFNNQCCVYNLTFKCIYIEYIHILLHFNNCIMFCHNMVSIGISNNNDVYHFNMFILIRGYIGFWTIKFSEINTNLQLPVPSFQIYGEIFNLHWLFVDKNIKKQGFCQNNSSIIMCRWCFLPDATDHALLPLFNHECLTVYQHNHLQNK